MYFVYPLIFYFMGILCSLESNYINILQYKSLHKTLQIFTMLNNVIKK